MVLPGIEPAPDNVNYQNSTARLPDDRFVAPALGDGRDDVELSAQARMVDDFASLGRDVGMDRLFDLPFSARGFRAVIGGDAR
ncbi:hypothetical protein [Paenibacillus methanolicus]|uniref:hypothetical protein n=1 Tax=Paenibacillus methanolicus TaxID=582686 RepID=UPI0011E6D24F|nr:hypothetical protein [Paenibacillus methanolicus]